MALTPEQQAAQDQRRAAAREKASRDRDRYVEGLERARAAGDENKIRYFTDQIMACDQLLRAG